MCQNKYNSGGIKCELTQEKPAFRDVCENFSYTQGFNSIIDDLFIEMKKMSFKKRRLHIKSFFNFVCAIFVIVIPLYLFKIGLDHDEWFVELSVTAIAGGFTFLGFSLKPLLKFYSDTKILKKKKNEIDSLMKMYGLVYDVEIDYKEDIHGNLTFDNSIKVFPSV
ncbi:hypothetical protein [Flammeovirga sp. SJP92]|uniref:hypothetical protein n=1 Tax=Flammeovirga sp. SJP92 TaxID=1775430 RepID=UPI0007882DCA|nr:hypothetical protein [Flammeovirga sp. SJP92]KXX66491.1 hypothetical protein AVL50_31690 [Flammeovirga sp. SJP92]